jgi:hypothetical protein
MSTSNLPITEIQDSTYGQKLFFDSYGREPLVFPANDIESTVAFFEKNGFDRDASIIVSSLLLKQAKIDNLSISEILKGLEGNNSLNLNAFVAEVLNNNRSPSSSIGFRVSDISKEIAVRNISA